MALKATLQTDTGSTKKKTATTAKTTTTTTKATTTPIVKPAATNNNTNTVKAYTDSGSNPAPTSSTTVKPTSTEAIKGTAPVVAPVAQEPAALPPIVKPQAAGNIGNAVTAMADTGTGVTPATKTTAVAKAIIPTEEQIIDARVKDLQQNNVWGELSDYSAYQKILDGAVSPNFPSPYQPKGEIINPYASTTAQEPYNTNNRDLLKNPVTFGEANVKKNQQTNPYLKRQKIQEMTDTGGAPFWKYNGDHQAELMPSSVAQPTTQVASTGNSGGGSGKASGASGSGGGSASVSTSSGSSAGNVGASGGTEQVGSSGTPGGANPYLEKLMTMQFSYDPSQDMAYRQAASDLENTVTQMMVGRGGLYSSVNNTMLVNKIAELQIQYEELAYNKYKEDREMTYQMAQFQESMNNTAWEQQFKIAQFKADREDAAFSKQMQLRSEQRANASLALQRQAANTAAKAAESKAAYYASLKSATSALSEFDAMVKEWSKTGSANSAVYKYFYDYGVSYGDSIADWGDVVDEVYQQLNNNITAVQADGVFIDASDEAGEYLNILYGSTEQADATDTQFANYKRQKSNIIAQAQASDDEEKFIRQAINALTANPDYYKQSMGSTYYRNLVNDLEAELG